MGQLKKYIMDIRKEEADNKTQDIIQKSSITLDNDDSKGGDNVQTKNSQSSAKFDIQNFKPREHLRSGVRDTVRSCNSILASLEFAKHESTTSFVPTVRPVFDRGSTILSRSALFSKGNVGFNELQQNFGPQVVVGAAATALIVGLRRGRISGGFTGVLVGFLSYTGLYGIENIQIPEINRISDWIKSAGQAK